MGGDFNEILSNEEKRGGVARAPAIMNGFRDGLEDCGLVDLGFTGFPITWSNQWVDPFTVRCRLDRFCGNETWSSFAPSAHVLHLTYPGSDHVPLILHIRGQGSGPPGPRRHPWRFNAHRIRKGECEEVIKEGLKSARAPDCFDRLFTGIETCQLGLRQWSNEFHNNSRKQIETVSLMSDSSSLGGSGLLS